MKKIEGKENLPKHLQAFAKELGGKLANVPNTEFYELNSISEFEKNAIEIGYEIVPTIDESTNRGFLVGFDVSEPKNIVTLLSYVTLKIYFVECSDKQINEWMNKIKSHRDQQQEAMFNKREEIKLNRKARRAKK